MREELYEISNTILNPSVRAWKEQGRKVIGFLCSYVPEEIISAAGILPYRIRGTGCIKSIRGDEWMSNFSCSFARSCLEFAMNGTYDFLDGLVALDSCGQIHRLYDNWRLNSRLPFMRFLSVPHKNTESAVLWYRDEIAGLKQGLEEFSGEEITREKLEKAINTYNETGNLLREVYELRKGSVPPITGYETLRLVLAAMS
ncbi:MAG: 2-hydroxyacyl-CoA dehydratase family protein, partial [Thermodesulfobacteriota bacterium]|nr:2-hydroxyacyl-CoA dehydratase family protein [Thermodesulfobacteriota bacterium]